MNSSEEKVKLLTLAHLKTGKKPKEVAELMDISYARALRLNKELQEAETRNSVLELFDLSEAALDSLLDAAKSNLSPAAEVVSMDAIDGEFQQLKKSINQLDLLDQDFQKAARELARQIQILAAASNNSDTIVNLSIALSKLQESFFAKGTNVQVNQYNSNDSAGFEQYLRD